LLRDVGVTEFNRRRKDKAAISLFPEREFVEEFEREQALANVVQLWGGEWISRKDWLSLSVEDQDYLRRNGLAEFNRKREAENYYKEEMAQAQYIAEVKAQDARQDVNDLLERVYGRGWIPEEPEATMTPEFLSSWVEEDPAGFTRDLIKRGRSLDTETMLRTLGADDATIDEIFAVPLPRLPFLSEIYGLEPDVMPLPAPTLEPKLTWPQEAVDFLKENQKRIYREAGSPNAGDPITVKWAIFLSEMSPSLMERPPLELEEAAEGYIDEPFWKNAWDAFVLGMRDIPRKILGYVTKVLPEQIFADPLNRYTPGEVARLESEHPGFTEELEKQRESFKALRDRFGRIYTAEKEKNEQWLKDRPELIPPPKYIEGPVLGGDAGYWAYTIADMSAFSLAVMGVTLGVAFITKNPWAALMAGWASMTPLDSMELYEDLAASGAPEDEAVKIAMTVGPFISLIEVALDLPLFAAASPMFRFFRKDIKRKVVKGVAGNLIKKGLGAGKTFTIIEITQALQEEVQNATQNAFVGIYDKDRKIFENAGAIFFRTLMGSMPWGIFGGAMSMRHVGAAEVKATPIEEQEGWQQDEITEEWYKQEKLVDIYERSFNEYYEAGFSEEQAKLKAINEVARTPEGGKILEETAKEIDEGVSPLLEEARAFKILEVKAAVTPGVKAYTTEADKLAHIADLETRLAGLEKSIKERPMEPWRMARETVRDITQRMLEAARKGTVEAALPTAEAGEPEAGVQAGMMGVPEEEYRPVGKGKVTQMSMDEYAKYQEAMEQEASNLSAEIEGLQEWLASDQSRKLVDLIKKTGWNKGEVGNLTLRQYRALTGKTTISPNIRTPDKKHVRWEYALDEVAEDMGYANDEELKAAIEQAGRGLRRIKTLQRELAMTEREAVAPPPAVEEVKTAAPPPEGAVKRVFDRIQIESEGEGFIDKIRRGYHQFQVKMVDDLYSIKKFTEAYTEGGVELSIEENPYLLARLLKGVASKATVFIEQGTFGRTFWKIEKGKAVPNFTGESLESILKEVKEPGVWQDFSTYLVAKRAVELSARNIKTGVELTDAKAVIKEFETKNKNFPDLADRLYKYQDNLLVYGKEMGLLSEGLLAKLRKYGSYVPFYRVFNELQAKGFMGKKMADIASPIKKIKGSEREIINPLESIVKNTYVMISSADRNQIGIMMGNLVDKNPELADMFEQIKTPMAKVARVTAKELGVEIEGLSEADAEAVVDIFRPSFFVRGDEVTVLIDGKKTYFKVDPDLRNGLLNLDRESIGLIGKFLGYPAKWLRAGATLSPDFMVRNPARDALSAFAYSNYNFLPGVDFMRGVAGIIKKDADYQLFRASGSEHSMMVSMDREYLHKTFNEVVQGKKFSDYIKHPLELFQIISELGEKATRLGEFKAGIRRGARPLEAGYSARSVTLDFAQAGTTAHAINRLIAFFNANIRGWGKMFSSFKEHPVRTSLKVFVGITLPSILLYYANRDDERWKEIPQWQKDLFWIVFVGDKIFRIPKPFELGILFGSMPERFLEWLDNKDPKLLKDVLVNFAEAGSPGFIPTAILPIIENLANYSFFRGMGVVPASREKMPPELQYTRWTSEVSKQLGELLNMSPAKIDNLINGWTGGLGRYTLDILGGILKATGLSPDIPVPSPTLADIPVLKAFVVRNPYGSSGEAVESFYNTLEEYEQGEKYLQEMLKLGEQEKFEKYKATHPKLVFFLDWEKETFYSASARYLRRVARDLSELGKKQDLIYKAEDITPDEKRRLIDEIDLLKTDVARKALDLLQGKEPQLLQDSLNESIKQLGKVIEETPALSLEKPEIFDMRKLHTDFGTKLEAATKADLDILTNVDPLAYAYLEVKGIEKTIAPLPGIKIKDIKPDLKEGVTFEDYYKAWRSGAIKDEDLDNLTRRQVELLREYHGLDEASQKQFLKDNLELNLNPTQEWLKAHPKENAQLAVWGQAKILSQEAYDEAQRLIKELDIPDIALPDMPPKNVAESYFKYNETGEEFGWNSYETQLIVAKDNAFREWQGLDPIERPIESLELEVKWRDLNKLNEAYGDKDAPEYVEDDKARAKAREKLGDENTDWVDDMSRMEAYDHHAPADIIDSWVGYRQITEDYGTNSPEAKVYLWDDQETLAWAEGELAIGGDSEDWNIPVLRFKAKWADEEEWYDEGISDKHKDVENKYKRDDLIATEREEFLADNEDYRKAKRTADAYAIRGPLGEKFPEELIPIYVGYYEIPSEGYANERYLMENIGFYKAATKGDKSKGFLGLLGWEPKDFSKVQSKRFETAYNGVWETLRDKYGDADTAARIEYRQNNIWFDEEGAKLGLWKTVKPSKPIAFTIQK